MCCKIRSLFAAGTLVGFIGAGFAQSSPSLAELSVEQLKSLYLHCDRISAAVPMDLRTAVLCVEVGDRLREQAFGGSFEGLIAWWRSAKLAKDRAFGEATAAK